MCRNLDVASKPVWVMAWSRKHPRDKAIAPPFPVPAMALHAGPTGAPGEKDMMCFFHLVRGDERIVDEDGVEVADLDHAFQQVCEVIQEVAEDGPDELETWRGWSFEVTDGDGTVLFTTPLGPAEP